MQKQSEKKRLQSQTAFNLGEGIGFERIRRITGYLVGTLDRFNNAKRAEERDRVKHDFGGRHQGYQVIGNSSSKQVQGE